MRFGMSAAEQIIAMDENDPRRLESSGTAASAIANEPADSESVRALRRHLADERRAITHHFSLAGQEGYLTVGLYDDGSPGEIFIRMAKQGSTISGLMDSFAAVVSLALQHGVPLQLLCAKFSHTRFEPSGWSGNAEIGYATSLMDYLFRWLELKFLKSEQGQLFAPVATGEALPAANGPGVVVLGAFVQLGDAPACNTCGALMVRSGSCHRCMTCGSTSGCS
jgi:ribonucleoside-diphosphate reductase alpha chain